MGTDCATDGAVGSSLETSATSINPVKPTGGICRLIGWPGVALLILALALQLFYFTGMTASDDVQYFQAARQVRTGIPAPLAGTSSGEWIFSRIIVWWLILAGAALLPHSVLGVALPFTACAAAALAALIVLGRKMLPGWFGYMPALLLAMTPVHVIYATIAFPEQPATALSWIGLLLIADAFLRENATWPRLRVWLGGFLIALAYSGKETAAILIPSLFLFVFLFRRRDRWAWYRCAWLAGGAFCWLALYALCLYHWTGDALLLPHAMGKMRAEVAVSEMSTWPRRIRYWSSYATDLMKPKSLYGPAGPILLCGLLYGLFKKSDFARLLACLTAPSFLYLSVGSMAVTRYCVLPHNPRYLLIILPGMALLGGSLICDLWPARRKLRMASAVAVLCVAVYSLQSPRQWAGRVSMAQVWQAAGELLSSRSDLPADARLVTAHYNYYRLCALPDLIGCPPIEKMADRPASAEEWRAKYAGAYVLTTRYDRNGPPTREQVLLTLKGGPLESLRTFRHIGHAEPVLDRIDAALAWLRLAPKPLNPDAAVDLWFIPISAGTR